MTHCHKRSTKENHICSAPSSHCTSEFATVQHRSSPMLYYSTLAQLSMRNLQSSHKQNKRSNHFQHARCSGKYEAEYFDLYRLWLASKTNHPLGQQQSSKCTHLLDIRLDLWLRGPFGGYIRVVVALAGVCHVGVNPPRVHVIHFTHLLLQLKRPNESQA